VGHADFPKAGERMSAAPLPAAVRLPLREIKPNPDNPRVIRDEQFTRLVASLKSFPEMLALRPIVVNADRVVLGGNMRLRAAKEAGLKEVPVLIADQLTPEQEQEFVIKDNVSAGTFSWSSFFDAGNEWDVHSLIEWGLELPFVANTEPSTARDSVTDDDIRETDEKLTARFNEAKTLRNVTCPHCGEDFNVDA